MWRHKEMPDCLSFYIISNHGTFLYLLQQRNVAVVDRLVVYEGQKTAQIIPGPFKEFSKGSVKAK